MGVDFQREHYQVIEYMKDGPDRLTMPSAGLWRFKLPTNSGGLNVLPVNMDNLQTAKEFERGIGERDDEKAEEKKESNIS